LRLETHDDVLAHPIAGVSWEGLVLETLISVAPQRTEPSFYRTAAGAELDLVLDMPGNRRWAFEVKRGSVPTLSKGFYHALEDVQPQRTFVVYSGRERYPHSADVEVLGLREAAEEVSRAVPAHASTRRA
jgi:uncharacterized protein